MNKYKYNKSLITIKFYSDTADSYYAGYSVFYDNGMRQFYYWLISIKAVKNYWYAGLNILDVYIDPKKIDYSQVTSLWFLFEAYNYKGREELEKLLIYLPENDQIIFEKKLRIWKNNQL